MTTRPRYKGKLIDEDFVISGISGRFPESDSTDEFAYNLYNGKDMIANECRRWPTDLFGMDPHMGQLKSIDKLDVKFFGLMDKMGHNIDPQSRILLETTYEAIIDAGLNPQTLRGSRTGVYIGCSTFGTADGVPEETQPDSENSITDSILWLQGSGFCLYANRISFVFDFKGPSLVTETACSASCVALNIAMNDLRLGKCDQAIVGGTHINLQPFSNHIFQTIRLNPSDGVPRVWDEKADGFVRGETVGCLFIQKRSVAKRVFATILNTGVNIDGNKRMGMFYPSAEAQEQLILQVLKEANVDPLDIQYVEAHATGTKVGDIQEATAIYNAFCRIPKRQGTINVGLLKSVVGHAEGASGVSSITKVLLSFENECIPANKNLNKLKSLIAGMCPPMVPIMENLKYTPGIVSVNNIGVGGVNANVLLEPNYKIPNEDTLKIADNIPRIVNICSRTEEAFNSLCKWFEDNPQKVSRDFLALLTDTMKFTPLLNSAGFPYRGTLFIKQVKTSDNQISYEYKKQHSICIDKSMRPLWFLFAGLGGQWIAMAKALMPIKIFADKIEECHQILEPYGVDLKYLLLSEDKDTMSTMTNKFCATTAIEMALFDIFKALNIIPDGIMGHSFGEIAAAYADGCLTTKEALYVSYIRGKITESDKRIPKGLMAVIGMSWEETKKKCGEGVSVVCNNGKDSVVVSGIFNETKELSKNLAEKGVFVRELLSNDIPYHSKYLLCCAQQMIDEIKKFIPNPRLRSKKWISTSVLESDPKEELTYASAEYFTHNLISPVYFYNRLKYMPSDAIVVEIGPHPLFSKILTETLENSTYISIMKRNSNETNLDYFLTSIAKLYELGFNPSIECLYPRVEWPVARGTQSISSLMKWEHNKSYSVRGYPDYKHRETSSDFNETVDIANTFKNFFPDHKIDNNIIYPAAGYLLMAWKRMAYSMGKLWYQIPVIFEDVQFRRPVFLSYDEPTKLKVRYLRQSGEFFILENKMTLCFGKVRTTDEYMLFVQDLIQDDINNNINNNNIDESEVLITENDIYKDLRVCGYDYGVFFKRIKSLKTKDFRKFDGTIEWEGNWVTFMDGLLQTMAVTLPYRKLMVPVMIKRLICNLKTLFEALSKNRVTEEKGGEGWEQIEDKQIEELVEADEITDLLRTENLEFLDKMISDKYHTFKSILPFHVDMDSKIIVTNGIEIECVEGIPIPRKSNVQDLKLESYQFIANEDLNAINEIDKNSLLEYLKICTTLANKVKHIIEENSHKFSDNSDDNLFNKELSDFKEDQIMLKLLSRLYNQLRGEKHNISDTANIVTDLLKKPEFDLSSDMINLVSKNENLIRTLLDIVSENNVPKKEIKVYEINLTNVLMAKDVDNHLASAAIYPIDVSYGIAVKSIASLPEDITNNLFKLSEWNPSESTFPSDIIAKDLLIIKDSPELWNLNLDSYVQEIYDSIIERGFLLCVFRSKYTEPELTLNSINGKKQMNNSELEHRISNFIKNAEKIGLKVVGNKSDSICYKSILFRKVQTLDIPSKDNVIELKTDSYEWFESLKQKLNKFKENEEKDNIWLIARDSQINGIIGLINCLRLEPGGEAIRCLFDCDQQIKLPIDFKRKPFSDIISNDFAINIIKNEKLGTYRHLSLPKDFGKIESDEYFLNIGQTRDLSALQWYDLNNLKAPKVFYTLNNMRINQIQCNIYMAGLNFRDVMLGTGRIEAGPQALFTDCLLGFEFSGRRCDTGERVMGFDASRCFATSISPMELFITRVPDHWSLEEAVTILCTYSTVWYGLILRAQLKKNEKVLIHSGAGGVGQAAINICKYYNCDIFVTVGNEDKKKFLMTEYNIPENRIFGSRDIQFKFKIKDLTRGKGVDIVLNSLAGDKLDASYECVADCGRFVEIGKYDIQMNKQLGMFSFLRDISFIGVSVDQQLFNKNDFAPKFFDWMHQNSSNGMIKPINQIIFNFEDADKAFRYMTTGKHVGKIVLKIRDEENQKVLKNNFNPSKKMIVNTKTYFDPNKVFIITGGLGGFGLEMLHWMLFLGARKFVLTSRSGLRTGYQKYILNRLKCFGIKFKYFEPNIIVSTHDTNTIEGTKKLISDAQQLGPIAGIFHLALVLNDSLLENQSIEKFAETVDSKIKSFKNLDQMTRNLKLSLDYFVVFSSVSSGKGNIGQSNYGYGNSICERICEIRRKDGLHGLAIQWGPIDDVGLIADTAINPMAGVVKQRVNSCLEILDQLLQTKQAVVSCYVRAQRLIQTGTKEAKVVAQIWAQLGVDPQKTPDYLNLGEIGMESIFAIELQEGLERDYGIKIALTDVKYITIKLLKDFEAGKVNELKIYSEELKISRSKLFKYKFIIPSETHTKLNSVKTGKPLFFLPPIDGLFASLEPLAEKMKRPVIGLNWIRQLDKMTSIKDIYKYFMGLLKTLAPQGDYDVVGTLDNGGFMIIKMLPKAPIGRALLIDQISDMNLDDKFLTDEQFLEMSLQSFWKTLPAPAQEKFKRDLRSNKDFEIKVAKLVSDIREFGGKSLISKDLDEVIKNSIKRAKMLTNYRHKMRNNYNKIKYNIGKKFLQMNGKLVILKTSEYSESSSDTNRFTDLYFLPEKELEDRIKLEHIDEINEELCSDKVAQKMNEYFH